MSSIEKLSIRGIRSFSPNREEIIEFYHPLTVILGDNGCGKTTVIECLKVSCTGALPPGARSGQSFIHDPKIAGTNEVKASVRLRFRNRAGKPMVVQRTFQLQQQKTKTTYKAMDGVVRVVNDLGEKVSMSHKCAELDRHIPEMLGVSKAILESVIFCHQEESNWPLQEGAVLKKRFDDIFESARYTKALDAVKKLRKARFDNSKDYKRDLEVLTFKMKGANEIREKIEAAEEKLRVVHDEAAALNDNVEKAEETLDELEKQMMDIQVQHTSLERAEQDVAQKEEGIKRAYDNIEQMMSDTDEELEALLSNYDEIIGEHRKAFRNLQEQESQLIASKNQAQEEYSRLCISKGSVEARIQAQQKLLTELLDQGAALGSKYSFHTQALSSQDDDIQRFTQKFQHVVEEKRRALTSLEAENQKAEDRLTTELSELNSKSMHVKQQLKTKQLGINKLNVEKRENAAKLKSLTTQGFASDREVASFEARIADAEAALQTFRDQHDLLALKTEIQEGSRRMNDLNFEIDQMDEKIKVLRLHEREHIALEAKRVEFRSKQEEFNSKLAEKHSEFQGILGNIPLDNGSRLSEALQKVEDMLHQRRQAFEQKKKELDKAERLLQENLASSKHVEKHLSSLRLEKNELERNQIGELKKVIEEVTPGEDVKNAEMVLQKVEKAYLDAKDKTLRCKNTITFLSIFKSKGERENCCPLCQRGMTAEEQEVFIQAINEKTDDKKVKDKIKKAEQNESAAHKRWKTVEKIMPSWRKWIQLENLIPEKSKELDEIYVTQRTLQADLKDKKSALEFAQKQQEDAQRGRQELSALSETMDELTRANSRITDQEERLRSVQADVLGANAPSLTEVQASRDAKQADAQELNRQFQRKQTELQRIQEMQQQLQNDLHKKRQEKLKMDQQRMDYGAATDEQNKLREREKALREEIVELENELPTLERDLRAKSEERNTQRSEGLRQVQQMRQQVQHYQQDLHSFEEKRRKVEAELQLDLDKQLQKLSQDIAKTKQSQAVASQALEEMSPQLMSARQNLDQQETFKRHIRDNLDYRRMKKELEMLRGDVDTIRQKIMAMPNLGEIKKRVRTCKATVESARDERATLFGREQQLNEQIHEYKVQLRSSDFRNVDERYRQKLIQHETTMMAVADLDRYYKSLDQSLLQFHSKKIEEINSIIRSLWQITYKGQDIDTIELVSGQENESGSKAARSYNYRVVMKKGGTLIDMRGRCSAGQKVLAALVIRLALAETFCLNCGILALDEPTTNLDTENKYGLAQAITDILNARSSQQNFQLVCITHDEEFVQMLSRTQMMDGSSPEYYWRISREDMGNNRFCSKIERHAWRDGI